MRSRREFIKSALVGGTAALMPGYAARAAGSLFWPYAQADDDPWAQVPKILSRIKPPQFPKREFVITRFGAAGDGTTDCTKAFQSAIAACHSAGGGQVIVPSGAYLTGAVHLKSRVNLHVASGATIKFSRDTTRFLPLVFTRWEGVELMNYSPFIYAFEQENIAITGAGTIDGQADCEHWWPWKGRTECGWKRGDPNQTKARNILIAMAEKDTAVRDRVFGEGHYLRPQFIQPYRCKNVLIEGVTLKNSPMWEINPVLCTNVTVRNVKISSHGPNNDGCNPESSTDVLIKDCHFDTGDDCIAIKSGRNADGRRVNVPSSNIIIQGCEMKDGHGGVTIGSEMSGSVRNVFAEDCRMDSPNLDRALRIKTNSVRGGTVENVYLRNIEVGQVSDAVVSIDFTYEEGDAGSFPPVVRNIGVRNLKSAKSRYALLLRGYKTALITNIRLTGCSFEQVAQPNIVEHVQGLTLNNVKINGKDA
jgi:polygalacturonase